jgi:hypothetical protein
MRLPDGIRLTCEGERKSGFLASLGMTIIFCDDANEEKMPIGRSAFPGDPRAQSGVTVPQAANKRKRKDNAETQSSQRSAEEENPRAQALRGSG